MFWSKIWFILVAVFAAVALTAALAVPRPAERTEHQTEESRLVRSCGLAYLLLRDNARWRTQLASRFTRSADLGDVLFEASKGEIVSGESHATAKKLLNEIFGGNEPEGTGAQFEGTKPDFVTVVDNKGRIVAAIGRDGDEYGQSIKGYFLVDDALDGYVRDDLWLQGGTLYRVSGAPVITDSVPFRYAGAIILGYALDKDFASQLAESLKPSQITFYVSGDAVAASDSVSLHEDVVSRFEELESRELGKCTSPPFTVEAGDQSYNVVLAPLPGEAGAQDAFYAVYSERKEIAGLFGALTALKKEDLGFMSFPWIRVGLLLIVMLGAGLLLMILEADRPLRKLSADAVQLAKGDSERLAEELHRGKVGSIARSVNIAIDKLRRETKAARKDMDELLGPVPKGSGESGASPIPASPSIPASAPGGPPPGDFKTPPPSQFKFSDSGKPGAAQPPPPPAQAKAPPTPPPSPGAGPADFNLDLPPPPPNVSSTGPGAESGEPPDASEPIPPPPIGLPPEGSGAKPKPVVEAIDDDILGPAGASDAVVQPRSPDDDERTVVSDESSRLAADDADDLYFREIFEDFLALKRKCGENTESLTFEKFSTKLRSNRDALIAKHGCRSVKFQVYVKDGKAALKASPVR